MIMTDPIADMLTRIRNGLQARHATVEMPASKEKAAIAKILKNEGFITDYSVEGDVKKTMTITLKYGPNNQKVINGLKRISKPGLRVYAKVEKHAACPQRTGHRDHFHFSLVLMTDKEAKAKHVGGEVAADAR